jgi:hypothetical protein
VTSTGTAGAELRAQRPLTTGDVGGGHPAQHEGQHGEHDRAAAAGHRASWTSTRPARAAARARPEEERREVRRAGAAGIPPPAAGSSSTTRAPRAAGAVTSRPPWPAAIPAAIARPASAGAAAGARSAGELRHRRRQSRAVVADLDGHRRAGGAHGDPHTAARVLGGVADEVGQRLRDAQLVAADHRAQVPARGAQLQARTGGGGRRRPRRRVALEQSADVHALAPVRGVSAGPRGRQVAQRQPRPGQLPLDGADRHPPATESVQRELGCGQRPAQLVACARDELEATRERWTTRASASARIAAAVHPAARAAGAITRAPPRRPRGGSRRPRR